MDALGALAEEFGLVLFEDAAQAHGAAIDGKPGQFRCLRWFLALPTKNMTSVRVAWCPPVRRAGPQVRLYRNQGMEKRYENEVIGFNLRMTDVHAAIGGSSWVICRTGRRAVRPMPPSRRQPLVW